MWKKKNAKKECNKKKKMLNTKTKIKSENIEYWLTNKNSLRKLQKTCYSIYSCILVLKVKQKNIVKYYLKQVF